MKLKNLVIVFILLNSCLLIEASDLSPQELLQKLKERNAEEFVVLDDDGQEGDVLLSKDDKAEQNIVNYCVDNKLPNHFTVTQNPEGYTVFYKDSNNNQTTIYFDATGTFLTITQIPPR